MLRTTFAWMFYGENAVMAAPIHSTRFRFTRALVADAPADSGIYALWEGDEMIYVGRAAGGAVSIRSGLAEHLAGACPCTRSATHYSWELTLRPATREVEILRSFQVQFSRLPRCNDQAA